MNRIRLFILTLVVLLLLPASCLRRPDPAGEAGPDRQTPVSAPRPVPPPAPDPPEFVLVAVGDVMLDQLTSRRLRSYDPDYPFAAIAPVLREGDLVFANLECPISDRGAPEQKLYAFCARPFAVNALTAAGINLVSLANNHIRDHGTDALVDTLALLEAHGIASAGAGRDEAQARRGAALEVNGVRTAVLAFSAVFSHGYPAWRAGPEKPGTLYYREREQFIADIESARQWADVVIVSLHWGTEYTHRVNREQRETGRLAVDCGADLVLGHHSHMPQGIEIYRGKPIVYSLGNFLFYPFSREACNESFILQARVGREGITAMSLRPVLLGDSRPYRATGAEALRLQGLLTGLLDELGTPWELEGELITVALKP